MATVVLLQACIVNAGDDDDRQRYRDLQPTLGQELIDLSRARDSGAISESEYERIRARLINTRD